MWESILIYATVADDLFGDQTALSITSILIVTFLFSNKEKIPGTSKLDACLLISISQIFNTFSFTDQGKEDILQLIDSTRGNMSLMSLGMVGWDVIKHPRSNILVNCFHKLVSVLMGLINYKLNALFVKCYIAKEVHKLY